MPENIKFLIKSFSVYMQCYDFLFVITVDSTSIISYLSKRHSICLEIFKTSRKLFFLPRDSDIIRDVSKYFHETIRKNSYGGRHLQAPVTKGKRFKTIFYKWGFNAVSITFFHWQLYSGITFSKMIHLKLFLSVPQYHVTTHFNDNTFSSISFYL